MASLSENQSIGQDPPKRRAIRKKEKPPRKSISKTKKVGSLTNEQAVSLVASTFDKLKRAESIKDLEDIETGLSTQFPDTKFPKLSFGISPAELTELRVSGIIDTQHNIDMEMMTNESTLARLLFATLWKRGDAQKIRHIVRGILSATETDREETDALVFHQFGRHLANRKEEPIIDQHTIRAFLLYLYPSEDSSFINKVRSKETFNEYGEEFKSYRKWTKAGFTSKLKKHSDYMYFVDKILYRLGKQIKLSK